MDDPESKEDEPHNIEEARKNPHHDKRGVT
jgi:hypothetical protein